MATEKEKPTKCRGFGFIEFDHYDRMKTCLKLYHHSMFDDGKYPPRRINVELTYVLALLPTFLFLPCSYSSQLRWLHCILQQCHLFLSPVTISPISTPTNTASLQSRRRG